METKTEKTRIRKIVFARRKEASPESILSKSRSITDKILALPQYREESLLLAYMDCKNEVMTGDLIADALAHGKTVAVPRVEGEIMRFYQITSEDDLENGYFGIREPKNNLPLIEPDHGFLIMPGVAFDRNRHRIGYGGGFYDRYQAQYPGLFTCAISFEFQIFDQVPYEATDIKPKMLVTEEQIYC